MNIFVFSSLYYERWDMGKSPSIVLTQGGIPIISAFEPKSFTDLVGIRVGSGINF
jgi:hypothetical protein